jgi:hypothetical protein
MEDETHLQQRDGEVIQIALAYGYFKTRTRDQNRLDRIVKVKSNVLVSWTYRIITNLFVCCSRGQTTAKKNMMIFRGKFNLLFAIRFPFESSQLAPFLILNDPANQGFVRLDVNVKHEAVIHQGDSTGGDVATANRSFSIGQADKNHQWFVVQLHANNVVAVR